MKMREGNESTKCPQGCSSFDSGRNSLPWVPVKNGGSGGHSKSFAVWLARTHAKEDRWSVYIPEEKSAGISYSVQNLDSGIMI